jgi:hypothetical protein
MAFDPNQDFESYVKDVATKVIKESTPPGTGTPGAPAVQAGPIQLNIAGQPFSYNSKEELEQSLNAFMQKTGQTLQELQAQAAAAKIQAPPEANVVTGDDSPVWNDQEFIDKMTQSPREGLSYAFNQLIFDGKSQDAFEDMKRSLHETELTKRSIAAYQFKENHPEFPGGQEAAQRIDNIRDQMGLPYDYNGLEAAYLIGIQRGALPNFYQLKAQQEAAQQQAIAQAQAQQMGGNDPRQFMPGYRGDNPYLQAPPMLGRQGYSTQYQPSVDYDAMPLEQLEQVVQQVQRDMGRR